MKRVMLAMCMAACGGSLMVSAQGGAMDKGQMMKGGAMTVTGCVAAGKTMGTYMLTDAMSSGMMDKDKMSKPGMMDKDRMMMSSYELMGGELKPHIGHKVEVMGTMDKAQMEMMGKMSDKEKMDKEKMGSMMPMKLQVTSVKMISATCP